MKGGHPPRIVAIEQDKPSTGEDGARGAQDRVVHGLAPRCMDQCVVHRRVCGM